MRRLQLDKDGMSLSQCDGFPSVDPRAETMRKFAFLHIPKVAGTSFTDALTTIHTVSPSVNPNERLSIGLSKNLDEFDIVGGHLSYDDYQQRFSNRLAFTILRDPIERCLSWYWYCRNVVPSSVMAAEVATARTLGPEEYFSQDRAIIYRVSINGQSRQLGGHMNFPEADDHAVTARAKETLQKLLWIGFAETLEQDLARLRAVPEFARLPPLKKLNVAPRDYPVASNVRRIIEKNNQGDIQLYELAKSLI